MSIRSEALFLFCFMLSKFIFLFCSVIINSSQNVLALSQTVSFDELEKTVLEELKESNTPGGAVAIVKGDKVIFSKGFGISNVETQTSVTNDMLFRIGSVTKMFTATALLTLEAQGKLKLDDPIGKYVKGLHPKIASITLHQLLTHTSGMVDRVFDFGPQDETAMGATIRTWQEDWIFTEPGTIFSYSNPGYALLGLAIEEIGEEPFASQMDAILFKPLGMKNTTFRPTVAMTFPLSQGHNTFGNAKPTVARPFANNVVFWADGFMFSSVNDLARFATALMNEGRIDGRQIILPQVIKKLTTPYVETISSAKGEKYGYGVRLRNYRGIEVAEHSGAINGFGCFIRLAPKERVAIIVLNNKTGVSLYKTAAQAFESIFSLPPSEKEIPVQPIPLNTQEITDYVGIYQNDLFKVELVEKDGNLFSKFGNNLIPIAQVGEREFIASAPNQNRVLKFYLVLGEGGRVEYLHTQSRALRKISA